MIQALVVLVVQMASVMPLAMEKTTLSLTPSRLKLVKKAMEVSIIDLMIHDYRVFLLYCYCSVPRAYFQIEEGNFAI